MIETLKWKIIELLIRYRVLAPCYVRTGSRGNGIYKGNRF